MDINSIYYDDLEKGPDADGDIVSPDVGPQNFRINDQTRIENDLPERDSKIVCSKRLKITIASVAVCFFLVCLTFGAIALTTTILVNI